MACGTTLLGDSLALILARHLFLVGLVGCLGLGWPAATAAEEKSAPPGLIFDVAGLECGACVYAVQQAIRETKGVSDVEVMQTTEGYARVVFDPKVVTEHQIAQSVREAFPLHGAPYLIKLRVRLPAYAKDGVSAKVDAVFARWQKWVVVKLVNKEKGEFLIQFKPLEKDPKAAGPQGWSLDQLTRALKASAPEGLGLQLVIGQ